MSLGLWASPILARCGAQLVATFDGAATVEAGTIVRAGGHVHSCDLGAGHFGEETPPPYDDWHLCRCLFRWP